MSEKRFEVLFYGDVINCVKDENGKEYNLHELIDILMDQQDTIRKLQDLCGQSDGENAKLRIENKKLQSENKQLKGKLQSVTMLKDDYEELIESFEKKYGKNIEDVIDNE